MAHDLQVRGAAMSALLAGQGVADVARTYSVPISTVSLWKKDAWDRAGRSTDIGDLLLGFVRETLGTLTVQVIAYRDIEWLRKQGASDAAVLTGVLTDKVCRILEALEPGGQDYHAGRTRIGVAISMEKGG